MTERPQRAACEADGGHCITCGDEGVRMLVVSAGDGVAVCRDPDQQLHEVAIDLVAPVRDGDALLVHAGVAIAELVG